MRMAKASDLVILLVVLGACSDPGSSSSSSATPDPPGTVSVQLRTEGNGPDSLNFGTGSVSAATVNGGPVVCLLGAFTDLGLDDAVNFQACAGSIVDLGPVGGLGDVTTAPTAGYGKSAAATVGDGFAVKTAEGNVFRVFVVRDIIGANSGGIIGVEIKWAPLGAVCAGSLTRCNGVCVDAQTDVNNCGGCGIVCPAADAGAACGPYGAGGAPVCSHPVKTN